MFDTKWMKEFKLQKPHVFLELLHNFQKSKQCFYAHNEWHSIELPLDFIKFIENKMQQQSMKDKVDTFVWNKRQKCFVLDGNLLRIHNDIWVKEFFDKVVDEMMNALKACVSHKNMKFCQYVYVNGGFGENQYLQKRLNEEYNDFTKYKLDVIIAKNPMLSVLNGAMMCAKEESIRYKVSNTQRKKSKIVEDDRKEGEKKTDSQKCYHCKNGFAAKRLRCSRCKRVYYCSAQCQKSNWKLHKKMCKKWKDEIAYLAR